MLMISAAIQESSSGKLDPSEDGKAARSSKNATSDWWVPVWKGLFFDSEGRHYKRIKSAIWLLIYFFLCANRKTGSLKRKLVTISQETGVKTRTIRTWINILRKGGYIKTESSGRCLTVVINKWKTLPDSHSLCRQSGALRAGRVANKCHSELTLKGQECENLSHDSGPHDHANDITIMKIINDTVDHHLGSLDDPSLIADEICKAFKDEKNRPLYLSYVRKYPLGIIRRAFNDAVRLPAKQVRKNRGALFNYLVQRYAQE